MTDLHRLDTATMELGATDVVRQHYSRKVVATKPVSQRKLDFEHRRPRWLREMVAEATGVFFYVYPGVAATASTFLNTITIDNSSTLPNTPNPAFGSILQIGIAFGLGIAFAIITSASTSGGHFNPAITICFACWQGFPWSKVPRYIFAQILGSFLAAMLVYGQYHQQIAAFVAQLDAEKIPTVFTGGPASIFASVPLGPPVYPESFNQSYGYLFLIEFFVDSYIGLVIWSCLDPANPFISPTVAPFAIGLVYTTMIIGFADITIATNLAKDLGCRLVALIWFGKASFTPYSAISILVNVPATLFATLFYEIFYRDSLGKINAGHAVHEDGEEGLHRHITRTGIAQTDSNDLPPMEKGTTNATGYHSNDFANGHANGYANGGLRSRGQQDV